MSRNYYFESPRTSGQDTKYLGENMLDDLENEAISANCRMNPQRIVSKKTTWYYYMKVYLEFNTDPPDMTVTQFKALILNALNTLFGEVGQASIQVDVLNYKQENRTALLRVNSSGFVQLWGALTLCGEYAGQCCAIRVTQVSSSLMGLAVNSRTFRHKQVLLEADR